MSDIQAIAKRFIATLGTDPRMHSVRIKNLWNADGSPRHELHIATRGSFNLPIPKEFEGIPVVSIAWPKDR